MFYSHTHQSRPSQATIKFGDGADSFPVAAGTTLTELASRVDALSEKHDGAPVSIDIEFAPIVRSNAELRSRPLRKH
jgi:hypothetical protein